MSEKQCRQESEAVDVLRRATSDGQGRPIAAEPERADEGGGPAPRRLEARKTS